MKRKLIFLAALVGLVLASGCVVRGTVRARAHVAPPMVLVSDGVYVIEDYHEPVFYSDGYYWRYYGNVWYRSSYHTGGWVRWSHVPNRVVHIRNPHVYVRYRGNAHGHVRQDRPAVRDHRAPARVQHQPRDARPAARDHRAPKAKPPKKGRPKPKKHDERPQNRRH